MIHKIIDKRKSIRTFSSKEIEDYKIEFLFKAATLAPSSFNEQPWRFIFARRNDEENFNNFIDIMNEKNQIWAKDASLIAVVAGKKSLSYNGRPNKYYYYDTSSAVANLTFQALSMDLFVHQVGGFDSGKARKVLNIPDDYEPIVMLVIGNNADVDRYSINHVKIRKSLNEFVFEKEFGNSIKYESEIFQH